MKTTKAWEVRYEPLGNTGEAAQIYYVGADTFDDASKLASQQRPEGCVITSIRTLWNSSVVIP